jgi:hypothetical protein
MSTLRLATWNLRYDLRPDDVTIDRSLAALPDPLLPPRTQLVGEQPWSARRVPVARSLFASQVDLIGMYVLRFRTVPLIHAIGFQETLVRQVRDLAELLGSDFAWVRTTFLICNSMLTLLGRRWQGRRRIGGRVLSDLLQAVSQPLLNPTIISSWTTPSSAFTLLATDTFWLSHTPFIPGSRFPGAGTTRIATIAHFRLLSTGSSTGELMLLNAHLDHVSDGQRRLGAALLLHRARYEAAHAKPGVPIFVTGDFNRCVCIYTSIHRP